MSFQKNESVICSDKPRKLLSNKWTMLAYLLQFDAFYTKQMSLRSTQYHS